MKTFYLNGNQDSEIKFSDDGKIYEYLENNYHITCNDDEFIMSKEILEELINVEATKEEEKIIGHLLYNIEYNGAYKFEAKEDIYCCSARWCVEVGMCPGYDHDLGSW